MTQIHCFTHDYKGSCVVAISDDNHAVIFDPGQACFGLETVQDIQSVLGPIIPEAVFLTHSHYDHVGALPYLKQQWPALQVYGAPYASRVMSKPSARETMYKLALDAAKTNKCTLPDGYDENLLTIDVTFENGDVFKFGNMTIKVISTPGHTKCSTVFIIDETTAIGSETLGMVRSDGSYDPQFLIGFTSAQESIKQLRKLPLQTYIMPHMGPWNNPAETGLWDAMSNGLDDAKTFMLSVLDNYETRDEQLKALQQEYWVGKNEADQPLDAFNINADAMLNTIEREFITR